MWNFEIRRNHSKGCDDLFLLSIRFILLLVYLNITNILFKALKNSEIWDKISDRVQMLLLKRRFTDNSQ